MMQNILNSPSFEGTVHIYLTYPTSRKMRYLCIMRYEPSYTLSLSLSLGKGVEGKMKNGRHPPLATPPPVSPKAKARRQGCIGVGGPARYFAVKVTVGWPLGGSRVVGGREFPDGGINMLKNRGGRAKRDFSSSAI